MDQKSHADKQTEQSVGRGAAESVVREVIVDWRRPGQRGRSLKSEVKAMREVAKKPWGHTLLFAIFLIFYILVFQSYVRRARMTPEQYSQPALETFESELAVSLPPVDEEGRKKLDARRSQVLSDAEARHKEKMRWSLFWVVSFGGALLLDAAILVRKWFVIKDRSTEPPVAASPDI